MNFIRSSLFAIFLVSLLPLSASGFSTKVDAVAYITQVDSMAQIYGRVWPGIRTEVSHRMWGFDNIYMWGAIDYLSLDGKSIGEMKLDTSMKLIPYSFGLRFRNPVGEKTCFTFSLGSKYTIADIKNYAKELVLHFKKGAWGGVINAGVDLAITPNLSFDMDYGLFYTKFKNNTYDGTISSKDLVLSTINIASGLRLSF